MALGVESGREAHGFAQAVDDLQLAAVLARHQHVEAVGAQIHRRDGVAALVLRPGRHGAGTAAGRCAGNMVGRDGTSEGGTISPPPLLPEAADGAGAFR